jgi:hypothetical protein
MGYMAFVRTPPSTKLPQAMNSLSRSVQTREKVRKDIWLTAPTTGRLHHRIESDRSLVTLNPKGESIEVLEHLFGVRCWIQEKNGLRFVLAEEGTYKYNTQSFQAQDVLLSLYKIPQGILPTRLESYTPFLRGHADSITFSLQSGQPRFEAFHFQASLGENDL